MECILVYDRVFLCGYVDDLTSDFNLSLQSIGIKTDYFNF